MEKIVAFMIVALFSSTAIAGDRINALIPDSHMPSQEQQRADATMSPRRDYNGDAINAYPGQTTMSPGSGKERVPDYDHSEHGKFPTDIRTRNSTPGTSSRH